jgi:hypothetical protein
MSRKLTIVARTCGRVFAIHGSRYIQKSKPEIINLCISSLVESINNVYEHDIELYVLDDHSSPECAENIKTILSKCKFPAEFISVEGGTGASYTCYKVYELVENKATDLWYHVEDDYLHYPTAINDMIETVDQFEENTGNMIAINPHDDPHRYIHQIYDSIILFGPYRHYRTIKHSTYTCMASRKIYDKYRDLFQMSAEWILRKPEEEHINKIWGQVDVMMFNPIPSVALHLSDESSRDPYIDIEKLIEDTPQLWKINDE